MVSKKILLLVVVFFSVKSLFAQELIYPKGTYMSMYDIIHKQPSQQHNLKLAPRNSNPATASDYKAESVDKTLNTSFIKKNIWAISDGANIYINCFHYGFQSMFAKSKHVGKNILFVAGVPKAEAFDKTLRYGALIGGTIVASTEYLYLLDGTTGRIQKIDQFEIEQMLTGYPELMQQYKQEDNPKALQTLFRYAVQVN